MCGVNANVGEAGFARSLAGRATLETGGRPRLVPGVKVGADALSLLNTDEAATGVCNGGFTGEVDAVPEGNPGGP